MSSKPNEPPIRPKYSGYLRELSDHIGTQHNKLARELLRGHAS